MEFEELTGQIIGAAIEVHKKLGPGLLESAYEECLCHELALRKLPFTRQQSLPVKYKDVNLDCGYRLDMVIQGQVVLELKCNEKLLPIHEAQLLTYMRLGNYRVGLLMNFNVPALKDGIVRRVL